jgi:hypothetical protein
MARQAIQERVWALGLPRGCAMPPPSICPDVRLRQFTDAFAGRFSAPRRRHSVTVRLTPLCRGAASAVRSRNAAGGGR